MSDETALPDDLLRQIEAARIEPGRPLIAVDADEVLVVFVDHLARYLEGLGYRMQLDSYQLEGSIFPAGSDAAVPFQGCIELIDRFFADQCEVQRPVRGGRDALDRLAAWAQIVVLTNVPAHAGEARRRNLESLGIGWPVVVNSGGKGRALARMAELAEAPVGFVDDSVNQIESVARHLPDAVRLHFAEAPMIRRLFPECPAATRQVHDWPEAERVLTELMASG